MMTRIWDAIERKSVRRNVQVNCYAVTDWGFRWLGNQALDLSTRGMRIRSDVVVDIGEVVLVAFQLPISDDWVDAEASVARIIQGRRPGEQRAIGLRFEKINPVDHAMLAGQLRHIAPAAPARAKRKDYAAFVRAVNFLSPQRLKNEGLDYFSEHV